jgi:hypothetical protein
MTLPRSALLVCTLLLSGATSAHAVLPSYLQCGAPGGRRPTALATDDFDRNGVDDLALVDTLDGQVVVLLSDGALFSVGSCNDALAGSLVTVGTEPIAIDVLANTNPVGLAVAENDGMRALTNNGSGVFSPTTPVQIGSVPRTLAAGLLDDDTLQDVVVGGGPTLEILYGRTGGGFNAPVSAPNLGTTIAQVLARDVNLDTKLDLIALSSQSQTRQVNVLLRSLEQDRQYQTPAVTFAAGDLPTGIAVCASEDLRFCSFDNRNNDNVPDLVVITQDTVERTGEVAVFFGTLFGSDVSYALQAPLRVRAGMAPISTATEHSTSWSPIGTGVQCCSSSVMAAVD